MADKLIDLSRQSSGNRTSKIGSNRRQANPSVFSPTTNDDFAMKLLFWNAYHGFQQSKRHMLKPNARQNAFANHIAAKNPDVAILLEMTGFTDETMAKYAENWGHKHYALTPGEFPFAVTATDFIRKPWYQAGKMKHGFFMVTIDSLRIVIAHIPPEEYSDRASEAREILSPLIHMLNDNQPFLLLADLNCKIGSPLHGALKSIGLHPLGDWEGVNHAFASPNLSEFVLDATQDNGEQRSKLSDHAPLILEIAPPS